MGPLVSKSVNAADTPQLLPNPRRIVTAHDARGNAVVQSDGLIPAEASKEPGLRGAALWITSSMPVEDNNDNIDGAAREIGGLGLVMPNGTNHRYTDLAPGAVTPMHRTNSLDYNILISGEVVLILEDGTETHLKNPGDVVVQKGTMHAWRNPRSQWCRWVSVLIDAKPAVIEGKALDEAWIPTAIG